MSSRALCHAIVFCLLLSFPSPCPQRPCVPHPEAPWAFPEPWSVPWGPQNPVCPAASPDPIVVPEHDVVVEGSVNIQVDLFDVPGGDLASSFISCGEPGRRSQHEGPRTLSPTATLSREHCWPPGECILQKLLPSPVCEAPWGPCPGSCSVVMGREETPRSQPWAGRGHGGSAPGGEVTQGVSPGQGGDTKGQP